jgi:hypothetical protein
VGEALYLPDLSGFIYLPRFLTSNKLAITGFEN